MRGGNLFLTKRCGQSQSILHMVTWYGRWAGNRFSTAIVVSLVTNRNLGRKRSSASCIPHVAKWRLLFKGWRGQAYPVSFIVYEILENQEYRLYFKCMCTVLLFCERYEQTKSQAIFCLFTETCQVSELFIILMLKWKGAMDLKLRADRGAHFSMGRVRALLKLSALSACMTSSNLFHSLTQPWWE